MGDAGLGVRGGGAGACAFICYCIHYYNTMDPITLDSEKIDVNFIESEILKRWKDGDAEHNTTVIHDVFQKYLTHDKREDAGMLCLWCMMCRMFDDAYKNYTREEKIRELKR